MIAIRSLLVTGRCSDQGRMSVDPPLPPPSGVREQCSSARCSTRQGTGCRFPIHRFHRVVTASHAAGGIWRTRDRSPGGGAGPDAAADGTGSGHSTDSRLMVSNGTWATPPVMIL